MAKHNVGKFYISGNLVYEGIIDANFFHMLNFVPYRVEYLAYDDKFEYIGTSDKFFHEVPEGGQLYVYTIQLHTENDELIDITVT